MEVALAGLPPDVALWLLELRGGVALPSALAWGSVPAEGHQGLLEGREQTPLLRSATLEDLSCSALEASGAMDAQRQDSLSDVDSSDLDSDRSVDSLEEEAAEKANAAVPLPVLRPLPPLPRQDDMLARLSGGEFRALPAVLEEDEEDLTQDEDDDEEAESVTVLQAMGWMVSSIDEPSDSAPAMPALRRTLSAAALPPTTTMTPAAIRRTSSAPTLLPLTPPPTPSPSPSPTLTPVSASISTSTACAEALESSEALCRDLDLLEDDMDMDRTLSQSVSVDEDMVFDDEFLALCSEANRLVETCLRPSPGPSPIPSPSPPAPPLPPRPKFDINSIFDLGGGGPEPPQPPARKRRKALQQLQLDEQAVERRHCSSSRVVSESSSVEAISSCGASRAEVQVRCHTAELLLMTRASERMLLKRSRSVSAADREHGEQDADMAEPALCASSPELRTPPSPGAQPQRPTDEEEEEEDLDGLAGGVGHGAASPVELSSTSPGDEVGGVHDAQYLFAPETEHHGGDHGAETEGCFEPGSPLVDVGADAVTFRPRRKGSVSSDVIAWQGDLLWAGLSDSEDGDGGLSCLETKQWFSSSDNKGRVYFFEENSCESSWNLPDVNLSVTQEDEVCQPIEQYALASTPNEEAGDKTAKAARNEKQEKLSLRTTKSRSMVIVDAVANKDSKNISIPRNWPQLFDGDMCVLKEGPMYRTKITENGKKLRKNWASCHVVLTELFLLLFRDAKSFAAMKSSTQGSAAPRPELCVDLNGALIDQVDRGDKASVTSRKNVFLVSTVLGLQVLFQCDCGQQAEEWFNAVHTAIHNLPSGFDSCPRLKVTKEMDRLFAESQSPEQTKKFPRIGRSKSVKIKNKDGSIEDLTVSVAERQTKIKARLKKFFNRRPTMESLVKKGIWKDEPAFGCYLEQVCGIESPRVPLFVQRCIAVIESSEDNMKTDGLYRASGNLSQVQKIRLQVDQNNLSALDQEEDVHVLTGALKLFFRELKEPLIPYAAFSKAIKASTLHNKKDKLAQFREIVKSLPTVNHDTLKMLLKHLLKVTGYQEFNRMHIPNLAIVFGPTLMWPEQESLNMALDLMQQNLVIEAFLLDFENIFR